MYPDASSLYAFICSFMCNARERVTLVTQERMVMRGRETEGQARKTSSVRVYLAFFHLEIYACLLRSPFLQYPADNHISYSSWSVCMNNREETYIHILLGMMTDYSDLRTSHTVTLCPLSHPVILFQLFILQTRPTTTIKQSRLNTMFLKQTYEDSLFHF